MASAARRVWLWANTLSYPEGGGHLWVYLNWALGLRAAGCEVTWMESADAGAPAEQTRRYVALLRERLATWGLGDRVAMCATTGDGPLPREALGDCLAPHDATGEAGLL